MEEKKEDGGKGVADVKKEEDGEKEEDGGKEEYEGKEKDGEN